MDADLNITKIFKLYENYCLEQGKPSIKLHLYRSLFNTSFNYSFFSPKKDLCDLCEEFKVLEKTKNTVQSKISEYEDHLMQKDSIRLEREEDKMYGDIKTAVICFDLENVINLPKTNIGYAFYKRKLNVYNLTAHSSIGNQVYCAVWNETLIGRSGNDIASAVVHILQHIIDNNNEINSFITWSDS